MFPGLIRALKAADKDAPAHIGAAYLAELREAAFTFLYRLLFTLYAEDRDMLPKRDSAYDDYGLRKPVREHIAKRLDDVRKHVVTGARIITTSASRSSTWSMAATNRLVCRRLMAGCFMQTVRRCSTAPASPTASFAPLFDALSRTPKDGRKAFINYRDLSVRELGAVYEKLLEYEPVIDAAAEGGIDIRLNAFARKGSGSYYTPDELVKLIIERTVAPLIEECRAAFEAEAREESAGRQAAANT